ncbi:hypothetical protein GCM10025865_12270 [Paraoerskovia sediminicola]|uniref:SNARE associated Golgi protein n=1 Tax=Paraoerskovia sediminicola TaxID=1138587 RepID=A0ABM8G1L8_9CELL|nr:hypothetical protein GCM10025865_12270 [Paraoerskovia sediminicola]
MLALRPWGYLGIGLVWAAIFVGVLAIVWGVFVAMAVLDRGPDDTLLPDMSAVDGLGLIVVVPLAVLIFGPGAYWLFAASGSAALLAFTYVGRSLRPSYAHEALSGTVQQGGATMGGPRVTSVAMSLLPVRPSRWTRLLMVFYTSAWSPTGATAVATLPVGLAWVLCWPVSVGVRRCRRRRRPRGVDRVCGPPGPLDRRRSDPAVQGAPASAPRRGRPRGRRLRGPHPAGPAPTVARDAAALPCVRAAARSKVIRARWAGCPPLRA